MFQHFREHLDKLFAKGIGMLDIALNEAFNMLNEVSSHFSDPFSFSPPSCSTFFSTEFIFVKMF